MEAVTNRPDGAVALPFEQFDNAVSENFCPMSCDPRGAKLFGGALNLTRLNRIALAQVASTPLDVRRTRSHISRVCDDFYLVKFQLHGKGMVRQRDNEAMLKPGDFTVCTTSEPYELHFPGTYRQAVLSMPREVLRGLVRSPDRYLGRHMRSEVPANALLSQFVCSLSTHMDNLDPALAQRLETNVLDLLVTALEFSGNGNARDPEREDPGNQHLYRVRNFINRHLADPMLSPSTIAAAEGISIRYLHMLFREQGTSVSRHIQKQRLDACRRCLERADMNHLGAAEIGYRWGFNDGSHFSRLFKASYGLAPRQYRVLAQQQPRH